MNEEIGAPPVLGCATGLGATGAAVVDAVDMVQFTGSVRTGRSVGIRAAERLIPASLELGGKDAMIVLSDADLDRAVGGAIWGGLFNAGCVNNAMVHVFRFPLPMGGWKESGPGSRFGGADGILKYCRRQATRSERVKLKSEPHWYPYTTRKARLTHRMLRLTGMHDWRRRLGRPPRTR